MAAANAFKWKAAIAALLLAAIATPAAAQNVAAPASLQNISDSALLHAGNPETIADYLQQIGFRPDLMKDQAGDPRIVIGLAGVPGSMWFVDCDARGRNCESIRLQVGLLTDNKLKLDQVNEFNNQWRFATLSLDEDRDPILVEDIWLSKPGIPAAILGEQVKQFEAVVKELRDLVNRLGLIKPQGQAPGL